MWADFQWLYWATSGQHLPALATASPTGTARPLAGVLGTPNTAVLYGDQRTNNDFRSGFRLNGGLWLNATRTVGIEGDFFFLQNSHQGFATASNGAEILSRPIVNALTGQPNAALVSFPGVVAGSLTADARSSVIGGGVNGVRNLCGDGCGRLDLLVGYRYFNLTDEVNIHDDTTTLAGALPGTRVGSTDRFRTQNNFHGGVLGLSGERRFNRVFIGAKASIAFGANTEVVDISGTTAIAPPVGPVAVLPVGLLAQPTNIGRHSQAVFAVLPEIGLRAGVQLTDYVRAYMGYNLMYLSNVARAADQIDPRVNPLSGIGTVPAFATHTTDFWVQGVNLGVEMRY
jgi:hypothetical protein